MGYLGSYHIMSKAMFYLLRGDYMCFLLFPLGKASSVDQPALSIYAADSALLKVRKQICNSWSLCVIAVEDLQIGDRRLAFRLSEFKSPTPVYGTLQMLSYVLLGSLPHEVPKLPIFSILSALHLSIMDHGYKVRACMDCSKSRKGQLYL